MTRSNLILIFVLILSLSTSMAVASPVIPGLERESSLSAAQVGNLLISELRCASCHDMKSESRLPDRSAPDLKDVGSRVSPVFLERFIASPSAVHVGTTMPDLLLSQPEQKRGEIAKAITHFLVSQSPLGFKGEPLKESDVKSGKELFHSVGCIACHSPRDDKGQETVPDASVSLAHVQAKYSLASLADFLFQPAKTRPSGRMPDMKLTQDEARVVASYLIARDGDQQTKALQPDASLVAAGKQYFTQFNCAACHQLGEIAPAAIKGDMATMDASRGCLSKDAVNSPRFHLSDVQVKAIQAAMASKALPMSDHVRINMTLTTFNCVACHIRGEHGGVSEERNEWFQTTEKNLGDDARIPPQLTLVGAKLQTVWMQKVLFDGESVRPYMLTRMPQFGEANLRHLPQVLAKVDSLKPNLWTPPEKDRERELRTAGHQLMGDKGLNCVTCHTFNGRASQGFKGIDLMTSYQRLQPAWFEQFMRDPASLRPGIVMPTYWPGGKAVRDDILRGDTDSQIQALWYYMSLGTSAASPSGLQSVDSKLLVTDTTQTYRGRSSIAGYRGIAVGFPGGLNYAFNAETGTLSGIWRGDFVSVARGGQGSGNFNPAARAVSLAQDVSFFDLSDEKTPWPLRPTMTKEEPVNPDPLYPRNRGYQFKGYFFDKASVPTLMYRSGEIIIEDRSEATTSQGKTALSRTLSFTSPKAGTLWFRAMTGKIQALSKQQYKTNELRLTIPMTNILLRPIASEKDSQELLLKLDIPQGKSKVNLTYELLQQ